MSVPNLVDPETRQRMGDLYGAKPRALTDREKEDARILAECPVVFEEGKGEKDREANE